MPLKSYRPLTKTLRYKQTPDFAELTTDTPYKPLTEGLAEKAGRNNRGIITMRRRVGAPVLPRTDPQLRIVHIRRQRRHPLRRRILGPDPLRPAEVGDARVCADAGAGEDRDARRFVHPVPHGPHIAHTVMVSPTAAG